MEEKGWLSNSLLTDGMVKNNENIRHFNIRVYALIINHDKQVLLSDEFRMNMKMVKFPGGGLKYGEGTIDCLKRESLEEFGQEIHVIRHFYTTDFFQKALFYDDHQLISIYYLAELKEKPTFRISSSPFDFEQLEEGSQSFRWVSLTDIDPSMMSFPVDKKVARMLKNLSL